MGVSKIFGLIKVLPALTLLVIFGSALEASAYGPLKNRENGVTVNVLPVQLAPGQTAKFEVQINTHSGDLDHDVAAIVTLTDDQGREYRPRKWIGAKPGGHHRKGVLEFPVLVGDPKSVTLVIKNLSDVERSFKWKIEQ